MRSFVIHARRLTGARALLLVWGLWGFCLLAAPVSPRFDADPFSVSLLVCANVALLIGLGIGSLWKRQSAVPESNHLRYAGRAIDLVMIALIGLGLIAIVARQIDYFVIRHVSVGACIEEVRGQLALAGPNFMSLIFALLIPAGVAAGILGLATLLQRRALGAGCSIGVSALLVFALAAIPALLMRSRSPLFLLLAMALVTALLAAPRLSWRGALLAGSATLTTFLVMMLLFLSREFQCDQIPDLGDLVEHSRLSLLVPVRSYVLDAIRAADPWLAKLIYALVSVVWSRKKIQTTPSCWDASSLSSSTSCARCCFTCRRPTWKSTIPERGSSQPFGDPPISISDTS
jgi:hypothetical protein